MTRMRLLAGFVAVLAAWLSLAAGSAQAKLQYPFVGQLTGLSSPGSVAVDGQSGDTLVADSGTHTVDVFNSSGGQAATWDGSAANNPPGTPAALAGNPGFGGGQVAVAVNNSTGEVYVVDSADAAVDILSASGAYLGQLTGTTFVAPAGVAIDQATGKIYVVDPGAGSVDVFSSAGVFTGTLTGQGLSGSIFQSIAVDDQAGTILVADSGPDVVYVFDLATGAYTGTTWNGAGTTSGSFGGFLVSVAADNPNGHVYVGDTQHQLIDEFDGNGNFLGQITGTPQGSFSTPWAAGVDGARGTIYVGDSRAGAVDIFGQAVPIPDVTTGSASSVAQASATVAGTVNPAGVQVTSCQFEYGSTTAYGQTAPCSRDDTGSTDIGAGTSDVPVHANLTGLDPNTLYHFRLDAGNVNGTDEGQDQDQGFFTTSDSFGLQTSGPSPVSVTVSNSEVPSDLPPTVNLGPPMVANPADLDTQAGSHPFAVTSSFVTNLDHNETTAPSLRARDFYVSVPPGLVGSATAAPQCPMHDLTAYEAGGSTPPGCPTGSQVGVITIFQPAQGYGETGPPGLVSAGTFPVYNIVPPPGVPAELAFEILGVGQPIVFKLRSDGDYGLEAVVPNVTEVVSIAGSSLTLWGVPADPAHDAQRYLPDAPYPGDASGNPLPAGVPAQPFITLPTKCGPSPLEATVTTDAWANPGRLAADGLPDLNDPAWVSDSVPMFPDGITGCDKLSFDPSMSLAFDTQSPDSPAGVSFDLQVPQDENPGDLATPALKDATVRLPQGVAVSPSSADGLQACADQQIALDSLAPASCPNASQIGTVTVHTPLLPDPLSGQVFLGTPECSPCTNADAQDGRMLRGYIQAQGDGVIVKLPGFFTTDPSSGQLTAHFDDNPPLQFSDLQVDFKGGPRAPVATPETCGTFTTTSDFQPWSAPDSGPDATPSSPFDVLGCGNPNVFAPTFTAGVTNPQAGSYSPFTVTFSRTDADQQFSGLTAALPPGLTGKLAGVPLCSDGDASAGTCPAASRVGAATVASGPGSEPLWIPQPGEPQPSVYLTGPYKGAPYGLAVEAPAVAGPFNLGTVVVRQALYIDPTDAHVTVVSDPFPTILDGIPLQIRTVSVTIDRPSFTLNPTSCDPMAIAGTLSSTGGLAAPVSSRFEVGGCSSLGFSPRLKIALSGKGRTRSGDHPTLTATLTQGSGQANIRSARVALPLSLALDTNNSQHVCNYDLAQAVHGGAVGCPSSTIIGQATAVTPLLDKPLSGPVYLVQGIRFGKNGQRIHTLPSLLVPLHGQVALDLRASSAVNGAQQLVTTFSTIPDAPVSKFTLTVNGGPKGILVITGRGQTICGRAQVASSGFGAQSGGASAQNDTLATPCVRATRAKRRSRRTHAKRRRSTLRTHR